MWNKKTCRIKNRHISQKENPVTKKILIGYGTLLTIIESF